MIYVFCSFVFGMLTKKRRNILRLFYICGRSNRASLLYLSWLTYKKRLMLFLGVFSNSLG